MFAGITKDCGCIGMYGVEANKGTAMEKVYNRYASKCINYNKKRDINIDICRGIGILLVILGHQFQNWDLTYLMQFIYSFHMPLLFIISGIFLKKEGAGPYKKRTCPYGSACLQGLPHGENLPAVDVAEEDGTEDY